MTSKNNPIVFVVQDNGRNNLTLASRYGELITLLPSRLQLQNDAEEVVEAIREKLITFSFDDSILAAGDPACIGIATAIAAWQNNGIVHMLKFDRQTNDYYRVKIDMSNLSTDDGKELDKNFNV